MAMHCKLGPFSKITEETSMTEFDCKLVRKKELALCSKAKKAKTSLPVRNMNAKVWHLALSSQIMICLPLHNTRWYHHCKNAIWASANTPSL
jgi:hypothetical protein